MARKKHTFSVKYLHLIDKKLELEHGKPYHKFKLPNIEKDIFKRTN